MNRFMTPPRRVKVPLCAARASLRRAQSRPGTLVREQSGKGEKRSGDEGVTMAPGKIYSMLSTVHRLIVRGDGDKRG